MQTRSKTDEIIIHCASTKPSMDTDAADIDRWHRERGFLKIGYHFVIKRDGSVETGREIMEVGAHAKGHNSRSVGVCMIGGMKQESSASETNFTKAQWATLSTLVDDLVEQFPGSKVMGHDQVANKDCPTFNVTAWYYGTDS